MTSPAQLKYLDAIGIPVWVSRDLVREETELNSIIVDSNSAAGSNIQINNDQFTNKEPINKDPSNKESENLEPIKQTANSSAQNILNSLEEPSRTKQSVAKAVAESVTKSHIPNEPSLIYVNDTNVDNLLFKSAKHYVFASGNETADWMVIGHSPETYSGIGYEPFAGGAGELLVNMIRAVGIENPRQQAYLVNVLELNQSNDSELKNELNFTLSKELTSLIEKVNPKLILLVGQIAAQNLLKVDDPLIVIRSKIHHLTDKKIPCVVTYYPSYLLQKPSDKRKAWNDLKLAMSALEDVS